MTTLSPDRSTSDMRRGACPALSAPMPTGDGLLARVALTDAISPAKLSAFCRLALRHGNGIVDISARGNLQVRGLNETSAPRLHNDVEALDLPLRDGLAVETAPLAGLDTTEVADPRPLAEEIRRRARDIEGLAPKMSVIVDGGVRLRPSHLLADIRLVADRMENGIRWKVLLGGTEANGRVYGIFGETEAISATLELLCKLAAMGPHARGRHLVAGLPRNVRVASQTPPFGLFVVSNGLSAAGIGPAFGQTKAENLIGLCDEAERLRMVSVKPAFDHALLFFGSRPACEALAGFAGRNGFVISPNDPRSAVATCSGSPACHSAAIATHEIAAQAAVECADLLDGSFKLHIAGCRKGCAHPEPSALTFCGTQAGLSLIHRGKADAEPFAEIAFADTTATLRRLADLVGSERRAGESSAACLARLDTGQLAAAALSGRS